MVALKPLSDKITGSLIKPRRLTSDEDNQERVDALSQRTNFRRLVTSEDTPSVAISNNPLDDSRYITNSGVGGSVCILLGLVCSSFFEAFVFSFRGNIFSAPWSKISCVLSHSGFGNFF